MSSQNLEPRINTKVCANSGKSVSETSAVLSEAYGTEAVQKLSGINCSKRVKRMWKILKKVLILKCLDPMKMFG